MPLIVIEGIDGSGTTRQSKLLQKHFSDGGVQSVRMCLPSEGPFGQIVRQVFEGKLAGVDNLPNWRTMLHLFKADQEHCLVHLNNLLKGGFWVVSDRYWLSSMTYQVTSAEEEGEDPYNVAELVERLNEHMPLPDATIILDVSVDEGLRRKNKEPDLFEKKDFLEKVRARYLEVRGPNVCHVDTEGRSPEQTQAKICLKLMELGL